MKCPKVLDAIDAHNIPVADLLGKQTRKRNQRRNYNTRYVSSLPKRFGINAPSMLEELGEWTQLTIPMFQ